MSNLDVRTVELPEATQDNQTGKIGMRRLN